MESLPILELVLQKFKEKITKSYVDGLGIAASTAANLTGTPNISVGTITASGAITGNLTGNATSSTTAAALTTARTISGVSFDGSANITLKHLRNNRKH